MRFTEEKYEAINNNLLKKKRANPIRGSIIGIGVNLKAGIRGAQVYQDNWEVCSVDALPRMIEELQMLKEAIEEETGIKL